MVLKTDFYGISMNRKKLSCLRFDSYIVSLHLPASILFKSVAVRYRPVDYPDSPITARYRFIKNAYWARGSLGTFLSRTSMSRLSFGQRIFVLENRLGICCGYP